MEDLLTGRLSGPMLEDTPLFAAAKAYLRRPIKALYKGAKEPATREGCRVFDHENRFHSAARTRSKRYRSGSRRTRRIARTRRGY